MFLLGFFSGCFCVLAFLVGFFFSENHHTGVSLFLQTEVLSFEAEVATIKKLF